LTCQEGPRVIDIVNPRGLDSVELGMSSSAPISPTTKPSGCAESSSRMIRSRGSVPIAESMSA
jgi:hypothetical protein